MSKRNSKAFTLIELIGVLVIMAIIALIVTPLVMNIIRKARVSADKRSVDAYGRSIELAIAGYLLDTGKFPTEVSQLTIEYSGNEVVCTTAQINSDSSVYLAGCTVAGRSTGDYTYGEDKSPIYTAYKVGDEVTYNNIDYYVIKDSSSNETSVTLLKKTALTVEEVNTYGGVGTANNHVNMHATYDTTSSYYQTADDRNGYGEMQYYSSETCGIIGFDNNTGSISVTDGCENDYEKSEIKYVVDAWAAAKTNVSDLVTDSIGYKARLITKDEIDNNFYFEEYDFKPCPPCDSYKRQRIAEEWMGVNASWFTMSQSDEGKGRIYIIDSLRSIVSDGVGGMQLVRPVITVYKSALTTS